MAKCIFCKSGNVVKAGFRYNKFSRKQRYKCNSCKNRFVSSYFWKMKHKPEDIIEACRFRKSGMSYKKISKNLKKYNNIAICSATVYNWIKKYPTLP